MMDKRAASYFGLICIIFVSALLLASCSTTDIQATAKVTLEAKLVDVLVQSGRPESTVIASDLSEAEINQVIQAIETYHLVRQRWQSVTESPGNLAINLLLLESDYQRLAAQYEIVHDIVADHWDEYTPTQQTQLANYHIRARSLNDAVTEFMQIQDRQQALSSALELGLLIAQVMVV